MDTCLRKILIERDVKGAISYCKNTISDLLQNKLDISMLVISKSLGEWMGKMINTLCSMCVKISMSIYIYKNIPLINTITLKHRCTLITTHQTLLIHPIPLYTRSLSSLHSPLYTLHLFFLCRKIC